MFGREPASLCRPKNFLLKVLSPEFSDLGNCGPALSVSNVTVTPLPGKFPFRVLVYSSESVPVSKSTGNDGFSHMSPPNPFAAFKGHSTGDALGPESHWMSKMSDSNQLVSKDFPPEFETPIEQANYVMDIPAEGINVLGLVSGSLSAGDNTILHLRTSIQPFQLNFSGSIDLAFSHVPESVGSTSSSNSNTKTIRSGHIRWD